MSNTNCLDGMRCPSCGSYGPFYIDAVSTFTVTDDGVQDYRDVHWNGQNFCSCASCNHAATVAKFVEREDSNG